MAKNKRIAFYIPEEWSKGLSALAGTYGVRAEEVIRQSLPDDAVIIGQNDGDHVASDPGWGEVTCIGPSRMQVLQ